MAEYTSLKQLVDQNFTVIKVWGYKWKKWDPENNKMLSSDTYVQGFSKKYDVDTDKGKMDLGSGQLGNMLEACLKDGVSDINNKTFSVKSNGKEGMDVRYFINLERGTAPAPAPEPQTQAFEAPDEISLDDIPF